jgi:hypothetical protein
MSVRVGTGILQEGGGDAGVLVLDHRHGEAHLQVIDGFDLALL